MSETAETRMRSVLRTMKTVMVGINDENKWQSIRLLDKLIDEALEDDQAKRINLLAQE